MNQKREYRILEKKKKSHCTDLRKRERERNMQEQVSHDEVKHRNGTKKENWVQCVMQRGITHDDFDYFVPPFYSFLIFF